MYAVGRYISQGVYTVAGPFHPFGGAVDIIVVEQEDGSFKSTPWNVKFGKFQGVLKRREKIVDIAVNDVRADFHMYMDHKGEAYFLEDVEGGDKDEQIMSPPSAPSSGDEASVEPLALEFVKAEDVQEGKDGWYSSAQEEYRKHLETMVPEFDVSDDEGETDVKGKGKETDKGKGLVLMSENSVGLRQQYELVVGLSDEDGLQAVNTGGEDSTSASKSGSDGHVYKASQESSTPEISVVLGEARLEDRDSSSSNALHDSLAALVPRWTSTEEMGKKTGGAVHSLLTKAVGLDSALTRPATALVANAALASLTSAVSRVNPSSEGTSDAGSRGDHPVGWSASESVGAAKQGSLGEASSVNLVDVVSQDSTVPGFRGMREEAVQDCSLKLVNERSRHFVVGEETLSAETVVSSEGPLDVPESCKSSLDDLKVIYKDEGPSFSEVHVRQETTVEESFLTRNKSSSPAGATLNENVGNSPRTHGDVGRSMVEIDLASGKSNASEFDVNLEASTSRSSKALDIVAVEQPAQKEDVPMQMVGPEVSAADKGIEISLCRHLLTEGIGVEAAAKAFDSCKITLDKFRKSSAAITVNEKLVVRLCGHYYPWAAAAPIVLGMLAFGQFIIPETNFGGALKVEAAETKPAPGTLIPTASGGWTLWPFTSRRQKAPPKGAVPQMTKEQLLAAAEVAIESPLTQELLRKNGYYKRPRKNKVRTNVPCSEQLRTLNLKEGKNTITFTFITRVLGKQQVDARIYLWKWNTRVVISDVDGTITKSDVWGQVLFLVGKDWTQSGVTRLFSAIKENGYEVMFLSARSISQAYITRQFLLNLKQDGEPLPDGPVVISPDGLFPSLYREVIRRAPHEFKIACLEEIKSLFPSECNPFYAGFGNRETDAISYLKVGIPKGKIFIINPKGEVVVNNRADVRTYTSLHKLVDDMFPPRSTYSLEDYNSWNFWKMPLPDIEDEISNNTNKSLALSTRKNIK